MELLSHGLTLAWLGKSAKLWLTGCIADCNREGKGFEKSGYWLLFRHLWRNSDLDREPILTPLNALQPCGQSRIFFVANNFRC